MACVIKGLRKYQAISKSIKNKEKSIKNKEKENRDKENTEALDIKNAETEASKLSDPSISSSHK